MKEYPAVTLAQMLAAREARARRIAAAGKTVALPLVSFSMNIPGPLKNTPLIRQGFAEGCRRLDAALSDVGIPCRLLETADTAAGLEALYAAEGDPLSVKRACAAVEDVDALGRLFDMDVLSPEGTHISRTALGLAERGCMVCGAPGRGCASRRTHTAEALQRETARRLIDSLGGSIVASLAGRCIADEVRVSPKPGLVDRVNNGSHRDMDLPLFLRSGEALIPHWQHFFRIGRESAAAPPEETFRLLRSHGLAAEHDMLDATGGVNTHKGAIFLLGILCGAIGRLWNGLIPPDTDSLLLECKKMTAAPLTAEFDAMRTHGPTTAGAALYLSHGLRGARGEAADGFPSVKNVSLPAFRAALAAGLGEENAAVSALLHLIALGADTNMFHRGGSSGAAFGAQAAAALLRAYPFPSSDSVAALDREFIARNLSPGGCADLLAVTLFLHRWETESG